MARTIFRPIKVDCRTWAYEAGPRLYKGALELSAQRESPQVDILVTFPYTTNGIVAEVSGPYSARSFMGYEKQLFEVTLNKILEKWPEFFLSLKSGSRLPPNISISCYDLRTGYKQEGVGRVFHGKKSIYVGLDEFMPSHWIGSARLGILSNEEGDQKYTTGEMEYEVRRGVRRGISTEIERNKIEE